MAQFYWLVLRASAQRNFVSSHLTPPLFHGPVCFPRKLNKRGKKKLKRNFRTMAVRATVSRFPSDPDAQEASGLPWGVTVTPFATKDENGAAPVYGSDGHMLPRCENCYAYFNTYCELEQWAWTCSLCGSLNGLSSQAIARYSHPQSCAEMISSFIDLDLPCNSFLKKIETFVY